MPGACFKRRNDERSGYDQPFKERSVKESHSETARLGVNDAAVGTAGYRTLGQYGEIRSVRRLRVRCCFFASPLGQGERIKVRSSGPRVGRFSADGCVNRDSARSCSRFAVRSVMLSYYSHLACVARRATATAVPIAGATLILPLSLAEAEATVVRAAF